MNQDDETLLREMIDQSSEMWVNTRDRLALDAEPIVICCNPERAFYLERVEKYGGATEFAGGWVVEERPLRMRDAAGFFTAFGEHWPYWIGAVVKDAPLRAYIKNGRQEEWSISLDMKTQHSVDAVMRDHHNNGPIRQMIR